MALKEKAVPLSGKTNGRQVVYVGSSKSFTISDWGDGSKYKNGTFSVFHNGSASLSVPSHSALSGGAWSAASASGSKASVSVSSGKGTITAPTNATKSITFNYSDAGSPVTGSASVSISSYVVIWTPSS